MNLVGREIVISVGDPWDFESPDGENVINAKIVEIGTVEGDPCIIAEAQYEVDVPDVKARGRRFIISHRYEGDSILDIAKGKKIHSGVAIVPPGKSDAAAIYAIIGPVSLK